MSSFNFNFGNLPRLEKAACRDFAFADWFYPAPNAPAKQVESVKQLCRSCVVRQQCLDWAIDNDEEFGIWGGLTQEERKEQYPQPPKISRGRGHKVLRDMEVLNMTLDEALNLHGIQKKSFTRWQNREEYANQLREAMKGNGND